MAQRIEIEDITIPAGVPLTAPSVYALPWREGYPEFVEFRFPPGPSGLVGVQLFHSARRVIPKRANTFLVADNEIVKWALEGYPYNSVYTIRAYNAGAYPHTIQVRMGLNEIGRETLTRVPSAVTPLPVTSLGMDLEGMEVL